MKVSAQYAETHLSQLISAASRGEEVEIHSPGQPSLVLVLRVSSPDSRPSASRLLNAAKGEIWLADDWDSPEINREIEDAFEGSTLSPEPTPR